MTLATSNHQAPPTLALRAKKIPTDSGQDLHFGGEEEDRTPDLVIANDALSQLSYSPTGNKILSFPHALGSVFI